MEFTEGTKIEGKYFSPEDELNTPAEETANLGNDNFHGTKIGEQSDFEKSLGLETAPEVVEPETTPAPAAEEKVASIQENQEVQPVQKEEKPAGAESMADIMESVKDYQVGDIIPGTVTRIDKGLVFVDIAFKCEGMIEAEELSSRVGIKPSDLVAPGDQIKVMILKLETKEGYAELSKKRAEYETHWSDLHTAFKDRETIKVSVVNAVRGGLLVDYGGIRGFIPASHVTKDLQDDLEGMVNTEISVKPIDVDRKRRKVVLSHKMANSGQNSKNAKELLMAIEPGQVKKGKVTNIKSFGAFVDIGGLEGLVHISEMSWGRISKPEEIINIGDSVDVLILGIDDESRKISLGMKQLQPDPWVNVEQRYHIGDKVNGKITRLVNFGAFIELEKGLEGLIHISEISDTPINNPEDVVISGQFVDAKIIKMFPTEQRIGLSLREHPEIQAKKDFENYQKDQAGSTEAVPTIGDLVKEKTETTEETAPAEVPETTEVPAEETPAETQVEEKPEVPAEVPETTEVPAEEAPAETPAEENNTTES
jgi:small subunit ribosomal protein S1/4-hydroxy-3-methylbut-2-en-1-yl diphosphate reductase